MCEQCGRGMRDSGLALLPEPLSTMCKPVTYAGGARSIDDLDTVKRLGQGRVDLTIGSALDIFGGDLEWAAVVDWQRAQERAARGQECQEG